MRTTLQPHPATPCRAIDRFVVDIVRPGPDRLRLNYVLTGRIGEVAWPAPATSARVDELWRRTCFEAFARQPEQEAYFEFNFSPSTQWAAYGFDRYRRQGARDLVCAAPGIETRTSADSYEMLVTLEVETGRLALAAVIEETSGAISYWALAHPPGAPDFHHGDGFTLEI
jgi:hypothetical protein